MLGEGTGKIVKLASWGKFPDIESEVIESTNLEELSKMLTGVEREFVRSTRRLMLMLPSVRGR
jgi:hypothetical protein